MADIPLSDISLFSKGIKLPGKIILFILLLSMSVLFGIASVAVFHIDLHPRLLGVVLNGATAGIIGITIPAMLTITTLKIMKRRMKAKYIMLLSMVAAFSYSVFILLGSAVFSLTKSYELLFSIIFVSDAAIFVWWFFVSKVFLNQRLKAIPISLIQPTLNALFLIPAANIFISESIPLNFVFIRLYSGIFIFVIVSYIIAYIVDSPIKRGLGISGIDTLSQVMQNWLFQANVSLKSSKIVEADIDTSTLVFKRKDGSVKSIMFVPRIHYGLAGTLGSSNFPYMLERHGMGKYRAQTFVMHSTITEEYNAFSSDQYARVRNAMDSCIDNAVRMDSGIEFYTSTYKSCRIDLLRFGDSGLSTLTRAPKVTEDVSYEAGLVIHKELEKIVRNPIVIDAHNSRYDSAPKRELDGIGIKSRELREYIQAIKAIRKPKLSSKTVRVGTSNIDIYKELGSPIDMANGAMNLILIQIGKRRLAMIQFNANNMVPKLRYSIIKHVKSRFNVDAEVYTTDTHYVNSFENTEKNLLGLHTKYKDIEGIIDRSIEEAISNIEEVDVYFGSYVMKRFRIWGLDRDSLVNVMQSMLSITRILIPLTIIIGFFIAALVIALV